MSRSVKDLESSLYGWPEQGGFQFDNLLELLEEFDSRIEALEETLGRAARARVKKLALAEANRIDIPGRNHGHTIENQAAAGALRDFAALLED